MRFMINDSLFTSLLLFSVTSIIFTWLLTQSFKVFLKCWVGSKFSFNMFFADGDFPSTHSAVIVSSFVSLAFLVSCILGSNDNAEQINYICAAILLIGLTITAIILRDAAGHRHRQDNTNANLKILKDYIENLSFTGNSTLINVDNIKKIESLSSEKNTVTEQIDSTFSSIDNEAFKRVGHLKHEVVGGIVNGIISAFYPIIFFFGKTEWLPNLVAITTAYFIGMVIFLKIKPKVKRMRYKRKNSK